MSYLPSSHIAVLVAMFSCAGVCSTATYAANYPVKPVRMIVAVPPGGPADTLSRLVVAHLASALGQQFVMDNRPGANGNIAYEMVARAVPDGYTIAAVAAGIAINPSLYREVKFDPLNDFAPITLGITVPNLLVIHPAVAARTIGELIALAKTKQANIAFASAGNGASGHLALEQLKLMSGAPFTHVPYKGGGPALGDLVGGQVQALFSIALVAIPQVKAGRIRALAITSARRSELAADLPTVAESGFPGFECIGWFGWVAPARTPRDIVAALNTQIVRTLRLPEIRERLLALGADPAGGAPDAFGAFIQSEYAKWAGVIRQAKIQAE